MAYRLPFDKLRAYGSKVFAFFAWRFFARRAKNRHAKKHVLPLCRRL